MCNQALTQKCNVRKGKIIPFKWETKCQCFEEKLKALVTSLNTMDSNNRTQCKRFVWFVLFSNKEHYSLFSNIRLLSAGLLQGAL